MTVHPIHDFLQGVVQLTIKRFFQGLVKTNTELLEIKSSIDCVKVYEYGLLDMANKPRQINLEKIRASYWPKGCSELVFNYLPSINNQKSYS